MSRWRSLLTLLLLCGTLLLVGLLALQAQSAWTYQRHTAEGVLRDYSRLVADEFIRRTHQEIGYKGFYGVIAVLQQQLGGSSDPALLEPAALPSAADLVRTLFLVDPASGSLTSTGVPFDAATGERLVARVRAALAPGSPPPGPFFKVHSSGPAEQHLFIGTLLPRAGGKLPLVAGFEVSPEGLRRWIERMVEARPLLPAALGEGRLGNDALFLRLTDATGATVYTSGTWPGPLLAIDTPLGDAYSGVFDGLTLRTSIDPRAAHRLVIGGLPRSRLPVLLGLLLLAAGLLGAAVWQLRRERALARMRSEFVARVSHELRTPLTQIRMFAETLLLGRARTPEVQRRYLEIIDQEARRLGHLVENILQFSRSERGTTRLAPSPVELAPLLRDVKETFQPIARAKQVEIAAELEPGVAVLADPEAVRQVVLNLLDNAVKYGPPGQRVRVGSERVDGTIRLFVEDQGPGVPERDRERVWTSWQRLPRDERRAIAGSGIGLTVVRELVTLHGGRAWVESGSTGGARFVVELPAL